MADTHNRVELKLPGSYRLEPEEGYKFSLFPYAGEVTGLTERQVYYPLDNATLTPDNPSWGEQRVFAGSGRKYPSAGRNFL